MFNCERSPKDYSWLHDRQLAICYCTWRLATVTLQGCHPGIISSTEPSSPNFKNPDHKCPTDTIHFGKKHSFNLTGRHRWTTTKPRGCWGVLWLCTGGWVNGYRCGSVVGYRSECCEVIWYYHFKTRLDWILNSSIVKPIVYIQYCSGVYTLVVSNP